VNVTSTGDTGQIFSQGHYHMTDSAQSWDFSDDLPHVGISYAVIFNSGKDTTGLNSHFSQHHTNHPAL
jgi:hypothetical protein